MSFPKMNEISGKQEVLPSTSAWDTVQQVPLTHDNMSIIVPTPIKMAPPIAIDHPAAPLPIMPQTPHVS